MSLAIEATTAPFVTLTCPERLHRELSKIKDGSTGWREDLRQRSSWRRMASESQVEVVVPAVPWYKVCHVGIWDSRRTEAQAVVASEA